MNILYINHYAGAPAYGMEYRPYYLAREWVRSGHAVRILAGAYSHVRARQPVPSPGEAARVWTELIDGIEYVWYRTRSYAGNGLGRVLNIAEFLSRVAWEARRTARDFAPDAVIASSTYPMDIWVAAHVARSVGAPLVFEIHDLWPLSPIELGGMSPRHPFIVLCQAAENYAYRHADLVVSMLPNVHEHARSRGLDLKRLVIIPNGVALEDWTDGRSEGLRADVAAALDAAHASGESVVCYAGSHGIPNALDTLLDAAGLLREEALRFVLVGDGHERAHLAARVRDEGLARVSMFDPIPKAQIPTLLAGADMAYLGAPRQAIYRFGVSPNKMLDYMMAGVPILYAIEAGNDPVTEAGCGVSVPPDDARALADAIRHLSKLGRDELRRLGENGVSYTRRNHTYDVLAARFVAAIRGAEIHR